MVIGPTCFLTTIPLASMRKVSGAPVHAPVDRRPALGIVCDGHVGIAELREPPQRQRAIVAPVEPHHGHAILARDRQERRVFLATGRAPRAPDVQDPGLARQVRGAHFPCRDRRATPGRTRAPACRSMPTGGDSDPFAGRSRSTATSAAKRNRRQRGIATGSSWRGRYRSVARHGRDAQAIAAVERRDQAAECDQDCAEPDEADERLVLQPEAPAALAEIVAQRREQVTRRADLDARLRQRIAAGVVEPLLRLQDRDRLAACETRRRRPRHPRSWGRARRARPRT